MTIAHSFLLSGPPRGRTQRAAESWKRATQSSPSWSSSTHAARGLMRFVGTCQVSEATCEKSISNQPILPIKHKLPIRCICLVFTWHRSLTWCEVPRVSFIHNGASHPRRPSARHWWPKRLVVVVTPVGDGAAPQTSETEPTRAGSMSLVSSRNAGPQPTPGTSRLHDRPLRKTLRRKHNHLLGLGSDRPR